MPFDFMRAQNLLAAAEGAACGDVIIDRSYFLNKLSNAARASLALRGAAVPFWSEEPLPLGIAAIPSRATVKRGANSSQVLA